MCFEEMVRIKLLVTVDRYKWKNSKHNISHYTNYGGVGGGGSKWGSLYSIELEGKAETVEQ